MGQTNEESPFPSPVGKISIGTDVSTPDDSQRTSMTTRSQCSSTLSPLSSPSPSPTPAYIQSDTTKALGDENAKRSNAVLNSNNNNNNNNTRVTKYAPLGLNRRPLYFSRPLKPSNDEVLSRQTTYQRNWMADEKENLDELEKMMVPQHTNPQRHDSGWQPVGRVKMSRYTTGILTTSGWQAVEGIGWGEDGEGGTRVDGGGAEEEEDGVDGGEESKKQGDGGEGEDSEVYDEQRRDRTDEIRNDDDAPWLEDKYFDYDAYLDHLKSCTPRKNGGRQPKAAEPLCSKRRGPFSTSRLHPTSPLTKGAGIAKMRKPRANPTRRPRKKPTDPDDTAGTSPPNILPTLQSGQCTGETGVEKGKEQAYPSPPSPQPCKWELAAGTSSSPVRLGVPSFEKLTLRLQHSQTRSVETLTYPDRDVDWDSNTQIHALNHWRARALRDYNLAPKTVWIPYAPEQDAWLVLLHYKIWTAVRDGVVVRLPGAGAVTEAMNEFFAGKVFMDGRKRVLLQRDLREESSVKWKLQKKGSKVWMLRDVTRRLLEGKTGGKVYVPGIGNEELSAFRASEMAMGDGLRIYEGNEEKCEMGRGSIGMKRGREECDDAVESMRGQKDVEGQVLDALLVEEDKENLEEYGLSSMG